MGKQTAVFLIGAALALGLSGLHAQEQETGLTEEERILQLTETLDYQLLLERQKAEARRRNDIRTMQGDAELQAAHTGQLRALADNCTARKDALEAGVDVELCAGDEKQAESAQSAQAALDLVSERIDVVEKLEARLAALENRNADPGAGRTALFAQEPQAGAQTAAAQAAGPAGGPAAETAQVQMKRWLRFVDAARAVVRQEHPQEGLVEEDVSLRVPFDAKRSGADCVVLQRAVGEIGKGSRICRNWRDSREGEN